MGFDFPLMKVVSIFCAKCVSFKKDIKYYKFNQYVEINCEWNMNNEKIWYFENMINKFK